MPGGSAPIGGSPIGGPPGGDPVCSAISSGGCAVASAIGSMPCSTGPATRLEGSLTPKPNCKTYLASSGTLITPAWTNGAIASTICIADWRRNVSFCGWVEPASTSKSNSPLM